VKPVFGDTAYFLALVNARDQLHGQAMTLSRDPPGPMVTTEWILMELGDGLSLPPVRVKFSRLVDSLQIQPDVAIVPATHELFLTASLLFAQRPDKAWSLTDCTSFAVMREHGIKAALTADHHFEQAGFERLLHPST